jgi:hypothetical protein
MPASMHSVHDHPVAIGGIAAMALMVFYRS